MVKGGHSLHFCNTVNYFWNKQVALTNMKIYKQLQLLNRRGAMPAAANLPPKHELHIRNNPKKIHRKKHLALRCSERSKVHQVLTRGCCSDWYTQGRVPITCTLAVGQSQSAVDSGGAGGLEATVGRNQGHYLLQPYLRRGDCVLVMLEIDVRLQQHSCFLPTLRSNCTCFNTVATKVQA